MKKSVIIAFSWLIVCFLMVSCAPARRLPGMEAPAGEPSLRETEDDPARLSVALKELQGRYERLESQHRRILETLETFSESRMDNARTLAFHQQAIDHLNQSVERILDTLSRPGEPPNDDTPPPPSGADLLKPEDGEKTSPQSFQRIEPLDVVALYDRCLGNPCMEELAEATTADFRDRRSRSAWVSETRRHLQQVGYRRIYSRVLESKLEQDRAVVIHEAVIERHSRKILLKSRFQLVLADERWSIDRMETLEEKNLR